MFDRLEPLHAMMLEKGPETLREVAFEQSFGIDLKEAYEFGRQYRATRQTDFLNQAWERYYHVRLLLVDVDDRIDAPTGLSQDQRDVAGNFDRGGRSSVRLAEAA